MDNYNARHDQVNLKRTAELTNLFVDHSQQDVDQQKRMNTRAHHTGDEKRTTNCANLVVDPGPHEVDQQHAPILDHRYPEHTVCYAVCIIHINIIMCTEASISMRTPN